MATPVADVAEQMDDRVAALGFELVELEWAGSERRPIIRLRIDRLEGEGAVTVDDCAVVSRGLEPWLDELEALPERYVLEVSSPGVDRPLVRARDFERFAGEDVVVKGRALLAGRSRRLEGVLLGLTVDGEGEKVRLRLANGDEVEIPRDLVTGAHLVYRWS
jgi:ribosome maturation factor RimP